MRKYFYPKKHSHLFEGRTPMTTCTSSTNHIMLFNTTDFFESLPRQITLSHGWAPFLACSSRRSNNGVWHEVLLHISQHCLHNLKAWNRLDPRLGVTGFPFRKMIAGTKAKRLPTTSRSGFSRKQTPHWASAEAEWGSFFARSYPPVPGRKMLPSRLTDDWLSELITDDGHYR